MAPEGFAEYKKRAFCKEVKCAVQLELNKHAEGSVEYEQSRKKCSVACLYTTWQFHHWLIDRGYLLLVNSELKGDQATVLVNLDKQLVDWLDKEAKKQGFSGKNPLIEKALVEYKQKRQKKEA